MDKLEVPLERQIPNSVECGLVCLKMVYSYYGFQTGMDELRCDLTLANVGTYAPQLGNNALKKGFHVEIVTHNPRLVSKQDKDLTQEQLKAKFKEKAQVANSSDKLALDYFIEFMNNGGKINVKIPQASDLESEIRERRPVIALLTNAALYPENIADLKRKPFAYTFHAELVTGIEDGKISVNDPYSEKEGGAKEYSIEEFMFAVHSSSLGDLDNGCFIKIREKT